MFHSNRVSRQHSIQELLNRSFGIYADSIITDMEVFLEQNLHLSPLLLHKAKAIFSRYSGRKDIELKYLMLANEFDAAFNLFTSHIADSLILEGKRMIWRLMRFWSRLDDNHVRFFLIISIFQIVTIP